MLNFDKFVFKLWKIKLWTVRILASPAITLLRHEYLTMLTMLIMLTNDHLCLLLLCLHHSPLLHHFAFYPNCTLNAKLFMSAPLSQSLMDSFVLHYSLPCVTFLMVNSKLPRLFSSTSSADKRMILFLSCSLKTSLPSFIPLQTLHQLTGYYSRVVIKL